MTDRHLRKLRTAILNGIITHVDKSVGDEGVKLTIVLNGEQSLEIAYSGCEGSTRINTVRLDDD